MDIDQYFMIISITYIDTGIYGVPQEMRRTLNPLWGKTYFLANETIKVNPNKGKQGGIPEK